MQNKTDVRDSLPTLKGRVSLSPYLMIQSYLSLYSDKWITKCVANAIQKSLLFLGVYRTGSILLLAYAIV